MDKTSKEVTMRSNAPKPPNIIVHPERTPAADPSR